MRKSNIVGVALAAVIGLVTTNQAKAQTGFGMIPDASTTPYGGSGIPNNTSEYNQFTGVSGDTVTLGLAATQHYANPAPGNNGAGTYTVGTGLGSDASHQGTTWNFDFYGASADSVLGDYTFTLTELNVGNNETFSFLPAAIPDNVGAPGTAFGNSETLHYASFGSPIAYDPNANDTYDFTLTASLGGNVIGSDSITVIAGTGAAAAPDSASTMSLLGVGFGALAGLRRRLQRA